MGMKKLKKVAMIAAASMFIMMMPMIQTHAAPTDVIENNESGIPDKTLYWNILKVLGKQSTDTFTEQEASSVEELEIVDYKKIPQRVHEPCAHIEGQRHALAQQRRDA